MNAQWRLYLSRARFGRFFGLAVLLGLGVASPCRAVPSAGAGVAGAAAHDVSNIAAVRGMGRVSSGAGRISGSASSGRTAVRGHHGGSHGGRAVSGHHRSVHGGRTVRSTRGGAAARGSAAVVRPVRPWVRRPYYGTIVSGVALGTIIAATAVGIVPTAPASNLCWYWTGSGKTQGYWDYCSGY
jgi:hypothetical protein